MSDPFDANSNPPAPIESGPADLSAFDDSPAAVSLGGDQDTIKAINKRVSTGTKVVAFLIVAGLLGVGAYAVQRTLAYNERMTGIEACGEMDPEDTGLNSCLRQVLETASFGDVKERALMNLGHRQDQEAVALITAQLDDNDAAVRRSAAWALARIGLPAAESARGKLAEILPETNEVDRSQVLWTLAVLRTQDDAVLGTLIEAFSQGQIQTLDGFEPRIVADVLGVERLSSPALTDHNSEPVRRLTAHALAENGTNVVITPLARMLQNEIQKPANAEEGEEERSQEVIRATAAGLGRTGEADAARPLFAALGAEPNLQDTILDALEKSTSATDLAVLLPEAPNVEVKRAIVTLLAKSHDRRVADALAGLVTDEDLDVRSTAALALAQFGDARAKEALYGLTQLEDNDDLVSDALEHLRYVVDASDVSRLADLIEALPFRRAAILRALGATDSAAAVRPIAAQLDGDDMRAAALSLGDLNADEGFRDLLRMVERPQNVEMAATNAADRSLVNEELLAKRRAAIMAMGRFGRTDAVEALMTVVDDNLDDYELRSLAAAAIGQVADADTIARVIEKVGAPSTNDNAKRYYVQALWQRPHAELNAQLLGVLRSNVIGEVKRAAALALGYAADPANDAALMTMLDDEALRRNAAFAITLGGGDEAVQKLITVLAADRDLREVLQQNVMNSENDWFNLLTGEMFETGAIWRRMRAAQLLRDGDGERSYAYPWAKTMAVLRTGWEGAGGMRAMAIRDKLWEALSGEDPVRRELAAEALGDLPEISLLLRARDRGGDAEAAARAVLQADAAS